MRCLAVGAHPDDIEIGAAVLVSRLVRAGHDVRLLILTDHPIDGPRRRTEAYSAAERIGLAREHVFFLGEVDGSLEAKSPSVTRVRNLFDGASWRPEAVIAHTGADSHNDHCAANALVRAAFRESLMLFYSIHVSAETNRFTPQFFVEQDSQECDLKIKVLEEHNSQRNTISRRELGEYEITMGSWGGLGRSESFEVDFQEGAGADSLAQLMSFNDSSFHRVWSAMIGVDPLYLLHEDFDASYPIDSHESLGREALRRSFLDKWISYPRRKFPLMERFSNAPEAVTLLETEHVLLAGGAVSNALYRNRFIRFPGVDWVIEFEIPNGPSAFIQQRSSGMVRLPKIDSKGLALDLAILTVMRSPFESKKRLVSCAGAHGEGTRALLEFLANPEICKELMDWVLEAIKGPGAQVIVSVEPRELSLRVEHSAGIRARDWRE